MDETKADGTALLLSEPAMLAQLGFAQFQFFSQSLCGVAVMVKVDFDFRTTLLAKAGKALQQGGIVLLNRVKKGVSWLNAVVVGKILNGCGKPIFPVPQALMGTGGISVVAQLEMVTHAEQ
ncbi:hypothetical protein NXS98_03935 [Fontisphaera persica]|uniref:hypothetical protein n=1 Tax=Fontisphaera persica TaxID=2974023 RepID=UPI0024BFFDB3|nr:hypothetical protein [Fontisphaera persica]WCJ60290.1 hypothetical protein NXS98_03935 [Fontisphaera persica]